MSQKPEVIQASLLFTDGQTGTQRGGDLSSPLTSVQEATDTSCGSLTLYKSPQHLSAFRPEVFLLSW